MIVLRRVAMLSSHQMKHTHNYTSHMEQFYCIKENVLTYFFLNSKIICTIVLQRFKTHGDFCIALRIDNRRERRFSHGHT